VTFSFLLTLTLTFDL